MEDFKKRVEELKQKALEAKQNINNKIDNSKPNPNNIVIDKHILEDIFGKNKYRNKKIEI